MLINQISHAVHWGLLIALALVASTIKI